jgi:hypothetical protein
VSWSPPATSSAGGSTSKAAPNSAPGGPASAGSPPPSPTPTGCSRPPSPSWTPACASSAAGGLRELAPSPATPALVVVIDEHAELVARCGRPALEAIDSIAKRGRAASVTLVLANQRATMDLLGSEILRANLRVRFCLGGEDPGEVSLSLGLDSKKGWPPELLDAPGKFYLRARTQGLNRPPARPRVSGYHHPGPPARRPPRPQLRPPGRGHRPGGRPPPRRPAPPGGDPPPPPAGGGHANPEPPSPGGWAVGEAADGDPEVARLLAVLANAGPSGLTVT